MAELEVWAPVTAEDPVPGRVVCFSGGFLATCNLRFLLFFGYGSKLNHHVSIYQDSIWVHMFDPQPHDSMASDSLGKHLAGVSFSSQTCRK